MCVVTLTVSSYSPGGGTVQYRPASVETAELSSMMKVFTNREEKRREGSKKGKGIF